VTGGRPSPPVSTVPRCKSDVHARNLIENDVL
jgi:hypothetical protein